MSLLIKSPFNSILDKTIKLQFYNPYLVATDSLSTSPDLDYHTAYAPYPGLYGIIESVHSPL